MSGIIKSYLFVLTFLLVISLSAFSQKEYTDSLFKEARTSLIRHMPDRTIPILLEIIEKNKNNQVVLDYANINLAEAYRQKREYKKATALIYEVLSNENLTARNRAYAYSRMAANYHEWGRSIVGFKDSVIKYSKKCINISKKEGFIDHLASAQNELGYLLKREKRDNEAMAFFKKAYQNYIDIDMPEHAVNVMINISGMQLHNGNTDAALKTVDKAIGLIPEEEFRNLHMRLYLRKTDIYEYLGDFKNAFSALHKARVLQKLFFQDRILLQINEMSAKYDLQLKEQKLREMQHLNKIQSQRAFYLSLLSVVLIAILFILVYIYNLKRKLRKQAETIIKKENAKLKESLIFKREELFYKSQELSKATTNIISFNDTLKKIKQALLKDEKDTALSIINNNRNLEHNWNKFKLHFELVYPNFMAHLHREFSNLTKNESNLCAFILMEMKTVEIANLMGVSEASVSKSRNRLRKKLNLQKAADISQFLKGFI